MKTCRLVEKLGFLKAMFKLHRIQQSKQQWEDLKNKDLYLLILGMSESLGGGSAIGNVHPKA
jgi:hypothetical protein